MSAGQVSGGRFCCLLVGAILLAGWASGVSPAQGDKGKPDDKPMRPETKPEGTIAFSMDGKPWASVFQWLADTTNKEVITSVYKPMGTFTFIGPAKKKYTIPEVIDIINAGLLGNTQTQKFVLINNGVRFILVPADEKIDSQNVVGVSPEQLEQHGDTEIVRMTMPLKTAVAEDIAPVMKQMKGPFGEVYALPIVNRLVIVDTVGNLKPIRQILMEMDDPKNASSEQMEHICKYIRPHEAERILREQLGDPAVTFANALGAALTAPGTPATDATIPGMGFPGAGGGGGRGGRGGGGGFPGGGGAFPGGGGGAVPGADPNAGGGVPGMTMVIPGGGGAPGFPGGGGRGRGGAGAGANAQQFTPSGRPIKPHFISVDERLNKVLVNGPADKVALAKDIMAKIDVKIPGVSEKELPIGNHKLMQYQIPTSNAQDVAKILQEKFPNTRISSSGNSSILVYASPSDHLAIFGDIPGYDPSQKVERLDTGASDPDKLADSIKALFGDPTKGGAPLIGSTGESLIVRGSDGQIADIKAAVGAITGQTLEPGKASTMRVITVKEGSASAIAEQMGKILPRLRNNPIEIIGPNGVLQGKPSDGVGKPIGGSNPNGEPPVKPMTPAIPDESRNEIKKLGDHLVVQVGNGQLVDPQAKPNSDKPADKTGAPVTIAVIGNKIFIRSDDPFALALATELYRQMISSGGDGDFEPIPLQYATAAEIAKLFDQWFNGTKATTQQNPFQNLFQGRGTNIQFPQPPADPKADRIRIVADPTSNTLLVKASGVDMLTIRSMLKVLDTDKVSGGPTDHTIHINHATASDIASVLKDLYREEMNPVAAAQGGGGRAGAINTIIAASQNPNPTVRLTLSVLTAPNDIIVHCSESMYEKIKVVVDKLDKDAVNNQAVTRVIKMDGLDPSVLQEAIAAFQGQTYTRPNTTGTNQGGFPGGGGGGPGGGGGFNPGGGGFGGRGGGGGGFPGGGGGGFPGGGGGRGGGGGGRGMGPGGQRSGEPDFFGDRVKDDPQPSIFFDPQHVVTASEDQLNTGSPVGTSQPAAEEVQKVKFEQPLPPVRPAGGQPPAEQSMVPTGPITVEPIPEAGVIILRTRNLQDMVALERLIEYLRGVVPSSDVAIELIPVKFGDATSIINTLNQLYSRVNLTAAGNGTVIISLPSTSTGGAFGQITQTQTRPASVVLIPVVRQNAILVAVPKARVKDLEDLIKKFDVMPVPGAATGLSSKAFHLANAPAAHASQIITQFWSTRYGTQEPQTQNQIRVTFDDNSNTVLVQASPADMVEIEWLLHLIDEPENNHSTSILRIRHLNFANSDDLAQLLQTAINNEVGPTNPLPAAPTAGGNVAGGVGGAVGGGVTGVTGGQPRTGTTTSTQPQGIQTKSSPLKFATDKNGVLTSGYLTDVHFTSDPRTNSLLIAAPEKTMELLWKLIDEMDVLPTLRANVKVIPIRKADAAGIATTLQSLFGVTSTTGTGTTGARPPGTTAPSTGTGTGATSQARPLLPGADPAPGAGLIDLRINIDDRTNSIIIVGSPGELEVMSAIVARLDSDVELRHMQVYHLKNSPAVDMANALNSFLTTEFTYNTGNNANIGYQTLIQQVTIVAEPITNNLLISATDAYYAKLIQLLESLDAEPPQVVIQVLIAEVDLNDEEEFGAEVGLQTPVIFKRGIYPAPYDANGGTVSYAASTTAPSFLAPGATVTGTSNPTGFPGFNFNQPGIFPGTNVDVASPTVGFSGLSSLGVGRVSPTSGLGGLVLTASSDTFSLLIRALKTQNRVDVMSRPQIMTMDNQTARVFVGQQFPITTGSTTTTTGVISATAPPTPVGVQLQVTPRISPEGKIIMRVTPEVSSAFQTTVSLGSGVFATAINQQTLDTTVIAGDGETVALGGLIMKSDNKTENKVPWLGELPGIGALFRFRTQAKKKQELLIIMTPHIVRNRLEANRILAEEARRIDWIKGDVLKIQGTSGMEPILPPINGGQGYPGQYGTPGGNCAPGNSVVIPPMVHPQANPAQGVVPPPPMPGELPLPRRLPGDQSQSQQGPALYQGSPVNFNGQAVPGPVDANGYPVQPQYPAATYPPVQDNGNYPTGPRVQTLTAPLVPVTQDAQPAAPQGKESKPWSLFNR